MNYGSQVKSTAKTHRKKKDTKGEGEFLSGFTKDDKLIPIIPITFYVGTDAWDGPTSLHEMFPGLDERLVPYVPNYRVVLVSPRDISEEKLGQLETDLWNLMIALKYSDDKGKLQDVFKNNPQFRDVSNETVEAINLFMGMKVPVNEKGETTDMCKAWEEISEELLEQGIERGMKQGIERGKAEVVCSMLKKNFSCEEVAGILEMDVEKICMIEAEMLQKV